MVDALMAYNPRLAGAVLSSHGRCQLDFAQSRIEVLVEMVSKLGEKRSLKFLNEKLQLFVTVDGGVRCATDVLKAVVFKGATAVGIGRPFLYGFEGVDKALQTLHVGSMTTCWLQTLLKTFATAVIYSEIGANAFPAPGICRPYPLNYSVGMPR
ncbi:hypothetical protein D9756_004372 [Leucocoprinus leucothites]|uniref:FMN-dependent dehydrogenase domain-containing protein n=1 Tax=Leucocoprinus leucothites TaxID=201217 RepID=A0A8H5G0E5_9AGAR|nr:hypothetical protein D9756_004372 [Leucoagaricus leucothites]